jgi:hypothetical protein
MNNKEPNAVDLYLWGHITMLEVIEAFLQGDITEEQLLYTNKSRSIGGITNLTYPEE